MSPIIAFLDACRRWAPAVLLALWAAFAAVATPALAQESPPPTGQAPNLKEVERLLQTLENETERERLIGQLRTLVEADRAVAEKAPVLSVESIGASILLTISRSVEAAGGQLTEAANVVLDLPAVAEFVVEQAKDPDVRIRWLEILGKLVLIVTAGLVAEWLVARLLVRPRKALATSEADSLLIRIPFLAAHTLVDLLPIAAFAAVAYGVIPLTEPRPVTRLVALAIINANVIVRAITALARLVLVPDVSGLRLVRLDDETVHYLYIWIRRFALVGVYGFFAIEAALLLGLPGGAHALLAKSLGLVLAGMTIVFVLQNRAVVADWLRRPHDEPGPAAALVGLRQRLADVWHILVIVYVFAVFVVWALEIEGGFRFVARATALTLVVLTLARFASLGLQRGIERVFRLSEEVRTRYPLMEKRANRYLPVLHRVLRGAVAVIATLSLFQVWGIDVLELLGSETGQTILGRALTIIVILVGTILIWEFISSLIERALERAEKSDVVSGRVTRIRTLLPLLRTVVRVVFVVIVVLVVLSELGLDIAPLLAGAGVVGLAVGFGAQTLVKDVITGVFILLEDTIAVGDWIDIDGRFGMVESMTIRTLTLRDIDGSVHTMPFGEVVAVRNYARDYGYALMDLGVAYREDVEQVAEIIKGVGEELLADPGTAASILEPLEVQGLQSFDDSAVVIRVRIKTKPLAQWRMKREFNRRIKRAFDERGIEIPFPHRTIYFGEDKAGKAPPMHLAVDARAGGPGQAPGGEAGSDPDLAAAPRPAGP